MESQEREILRFTTAGSVDDGKSTLIGRLLYDSKSIFQDQLDAVEASSKKKGLEHLDLSLLTDGLKDEIEQGITIDVAYRYFSTPKRKFIIADTPGHIQYTRNMVTGASTADLALILIDARKGVIEQTKRHTYLASLLQIPHLIVCVNKMDLVAYSEEAYDKVVADYKKLAKSLNLKDVRFIPISALKGDNVVDKTAATYWYKGDSLLHTLENIEVSTDKDLSRLRFPIQTVIRPQSDKYHDFRGYAGRLASGLIKVGDEIKVLPTGLKSKIKSIQTFDGELKEAYPPMSITVTLEDDVDVSRGNMIVNEVDGPIETKEFDAMLCWLSSKPANLRAKFYLRQTSNEVKAMIKNVAFKVDINSMEEVTEVTDIKMNDIVRVTLKTTQPLFIDKYNDNRTTGSIILIDETTNETLAAGMII